MANPVLQEDSKCMVISCPNYVSSSPQLRFFSFPSDQEFSSKWKEKCGIAANHDIGQAQVCSAHFKPTHRISDRKLKSDAIPTENLGWMVGESLTPPPVLIQTANLPKMQVVKLEAQPKPSLSMVKGVVDENCRLRECLAKLKAEEDDVTRKQNIYDKKIVNSLKEIEKLNVKIYKMTRGRKLDSVVETNLISKVFSQAQINLLMGKKKVVWSPDDMAMAFTLRHLGNRECYLYLKDTLNLPLPSLSSVQRWFASNEP